MVFLSDSNITKRSLASALKSLMEEMPFAKITVGDICEACNMNRKSFYYHFRDKYDLINWIYDTEFISVARSKLYASGWSRVADLCAYFYENRSFYNKVLAIEGSAVRAYTADESGNRVVDLMVMAEELPDEELPAASGDEQIKFAFDKDGCVNIYHKPTATGTAQWSKISSTVYPGGTWVRVTFTFDYSSASAPMCQVKLDGSPCTSPVGFHSPTDLLHTGSWYFTASAGTALAQIDFAGCGSVDDVVNASTSSHTPCSWGT